MHPSDRSLWTEHICNRIPIIKAVSDLPQTLVHGDLDKRNIGLRRRGDKIELLLIDWEFIGIAWPALDVIRFVNAVENVGNVPEGSQPLSDYYFERYAAHGGTRVDFKTWMKAFDLAFVYECLRLSPFLIGRMLINDLQKYEYSAADNAKLKVEHATKKIEEWLC